MVCFHAEGCEEEGCAHQEATGHGEVFGIREARHEGIDVDGAAPCQARGESADESDESLVRCFLGRQDRLVAGGVESLEDAVAQIRTDGLEHGEECADHGDAVKSAAKARLGTTYKTVALSLVLTERNTGACSDVLSRVMV